MSKVSPASKSEHEASEYMQALRSISGNDAISFAYDAGTEWVCICGTHNVLDESKEIQNCTNCHRNRDFVLSNYTKQVVIDKVSSGELSIGSVSDSAPADTVQLPPVFKIVLGVVGALGVLVLLAIVFRAMAGIIIYIFAPICVLIGMLVVFVLARFLARLLVFLVWLSATILVFIAMHQGKVPWWGVILGALLFGAIGGIVCIPVLPHAGILEQIRDWWRED